ncbi:MAG: hypothetical protein ACYCZN_02920 [Candidatus Dormibacteria bacterium]
MGLVEQRDGRPGPWAPAVLAGQGVRAGRRAVPALRRLAGAGERWAAHLGAERWEELGHTRAAGALWGPVAAADHWAGSPRAVSLDAVVPGERVHGRGGAGAPRGPVDAAEFWEEPPQTVALDAVARRHRVHTTADC